MPKPFKTFQAVVPPGATPGQWRQFDSPSNGTVNVPIPDDAKSGDTLQVEWQVQTLEVTLPKGYEQGAPTLTVKVPGGQVEITPPSNAVAGDTFDLYLQSPKVSIVERAAAKPAARKKVTVVIGDFNVNNVVKLQGVMYKTVDEPRPGALRVKRVQEGSLAYKKLYEGDLITKVNNVTNCDGTEGLEHELRDRRNVWVVTVLRDPRIVVT
jgi:hypothetical protein